MQMRGILRAVFGPHRFVMNNGDSLQRLNDATKVTAEPRTNNSDDAHSVYAASRPPLPPASTSLLNQSRSPGEGDEQQMDSSLDDDTKDVVGGDNVTQEMEGNESQETSPDTKPSPKSQEPTKVKKKPGRPKGSKNTPAKILKFSRQNISNSFPSQFENKTIEYDATGIVSAGDLSTSEGRVNILDEAFEAMKRIQKRSRELGWEHWAEGGGEEGGKEEEEEVGKAVVMQGGGEVGGGKSVGRGIAPEVQPPAKKRRLKVRWWWWRGVGGDLISNFFLLLCRAATTFSSPNTLSRIPLCTGIRTEISSNTRAKSSARHGKRCCRRML